MSATERIRAAADATVAAGTARLTMRTHLPDSPPTNMVGVVDFSRRRSWARLTMPPLPEGEAAGTIEVETVIDGPDFYLEVLELPGRWLRTRLDAHDEQMPAGDPGLLLDWLRGCTDATPVTDASDTGELEAFDAVLDLDRAVEAAPSATRQAVRTWIDLIAPDGAPREVRVWLDAAGRLHRLEIPDPDGRLELHLDDHGDPVTVTIPPDDAVIDPDELAALLPEQTSDLEPPPSDWDT